MMTVSTKLLKADIPVAEFVSRFVDVPKFLEYCKVCPNYGHRWSCPPFDFDALGFWAKYQHLHLMAMKITPETAEEKKRAAEDARAFLAPYRASLEAAMAKKERETPGSRRMNPGSCVGCAVCAREDGKPCRREEMCRSSLESLGTDVGKVAAELLDTPMVWGKPGEAPEYFLLVGGLLT